MIMVVAESNDQVPLIVIALARLPHTSLQRVSVLVIVERNDPPVFVLINVESIAVIELAEPF